MNVYNRAIVCVASSIQQLGRLESLLVTRFSKDYVIEVAETSIEVVNIISTLSGIGIETAVVISDDRVLDMSGLDLVKTINKKYPSVKMILTTDDVDIDIAERAINQENLFCLVKKNWVEEQMVQLTLDACKQFQSDRELENLMRQLRISEHEKSLILRSISESIIYMNIDREIIWKNDAADKDLKLWKDSGECYKEVFESKVDSQECPISSIIDKKLSYAAEKAFSDGTHKLIRFFPVLDQGNQAIGIVLTLLDITSQVIANNMNESLLEMSRYINETESIIAMYCKAYEYLCRYFNVKLMCVAGEDFDEAYIEFISNTSDKIGREQVLSMLGSLQNIISKNKLNDFIMMENNLGSIIAYPMNEKILMIITEDVVDQSSSSIRFINTITEQIKTGMNKIENLKKITYQARHDSNTGLYNREYFIDRLKAHLDNKRESHVPSLNHSIALIDLNYFKDVNDNFSHITGDQVLYEIANRLKSAIRGTDIVARVGGDEFAILFVNHDRKEITRMIRRLQKAISHQIIVDDVSIEVGSSIGIVYDISKYDHINTLLRDADKAMYAAKKDKSGIGHYMFFEKAIQKTVERHLAIEHSLKEMDCEKDLSLLYQPIVDLSDMHVSGFEGFLRWDSNDGHRFMPDEFIPIANESEEILEIGRNVIRMALDAVKEMDESGREDCFINVNLTSKQLMNKQHMDMVKKSIVRRGITSNRLRFDITDRFKDSQVGEVSRKISELSDFGVHVSLDDFGTGASSLVALNQMDVNEIKIDSSHISKIRFNDKALRMVTSIINLAKSMGIKVTAEGVEKKEELDMLISLGCDNAQGYYFSKPMPFDKAVEFRLRP